jgi:hypothetical protein
VCTLCDQTFDQIDYPDHIASCSPDNNPPHNNQSSVSKTKETFNTRSTTTSSSQVIFKCYSHFSYFIYFQN